MTKDDSIGGEPEFAQPPLPRGRHQLSPQEVAENQRRRLIAAMARSISLRGYAATSVDRVLEGSGVSRGTFYELFGNRQECLAATHEASLEGLMESISSACAGERRWAARVRAAVYATVEFADRAPDQARLLALDALAADAPTSRQAAVAVDGFAEMLRSGREHHPKAAALPAVTERALVGLVAMAISCRLLEGESPVGLEAQLAYFVLLPYLGAAAAKRMTRPQGGEFSAPGSS